MKRDLDIMRALEGIRAKLLGVFEAAGDLTLLAWRAGRSNFTAPLYVEEFILESYKLGIQSLPLVLFTGLFTGMVFTLQLSVQLELFDMTFMVGQFVSTSVVRELGPVLIGLSVAGRVGAGIAAELGAMVVSEQVDAMRLEGTDVVKKLVTPRLRAMLMALPLLTILGDAMALAGGFCIAVFSLGLHPTSYWHSALTALSMYDILTGMLKPFCYGAIIAMIGCYMGLRTWGSAAAVGTSATRAVVLCSLLIITTDFFLTKLFASLGWLVPVR